MAVPEKVRQEFLRSLDADIQRYEEALRENVEAFEAGEFEPDEDEEEADLANELDTLPTQEQLDDAVHAELERIEEELIAALHERNDARIKLLLAERQSLVADARTASFVLGAIGPWIPELQKSPPGTEEGAALPTGFGHDAADFAIAWGGERDQPREPGDEFRFPWIENAVGFLLDKSVVTPDEFRQIRRVDRRHVFSSNRQSDLAAVEEMKRKVAFSIPQGLSLDEFRNEIGPDLAADRRATEHLYRTNTHQAYVDGQDQALSRPEVAGVFPYVLYSATDDTRVRDEHWELDGQIALRDSELHELMLERLHEDNCRCALIPLSVSDAAARGYDVRQDGFDPADDDPIDEAMLAGRRVKFEKHPHDADASTLVRVDARRFDQAWKEDAGFYLPPESEGRPGESEIAGRRERFREFLGTGRPVQAPHVVLNADRKPVIDDGRHRTRVLIDDGAERIPLSVPIEQADEIATKLGGTIAPPSPLNTDQRRVNRSLVEAWGGDDENHSLLREWTRKGYRPENVYRAILNRDATADADRLHEIISQSEV